MAASDEDQELQDLQTAQRLTPDDWRTEAKLIKYYADRKDYKKTLSLSSAAYAKNKNNPTIGLLYVIALINNNQYASSLKLLEGMNILPFEGASEGKVVYDQACLFLSMDLIKSRKYANALKMIEKSKQWPENLGVGKPYDVDTRIQDYLNAYCLEKMNKASETAGLKKSIVDYTNTHKRPSFSNILALETLQAQGDTSAAEDLVMKMQNSGSPVQKWVVATAKKDQSTIASLEKEFEGNTEFLLIKRVLEVTGK